MAYEEKKHYLQRYAIIRRDIAIMEMRLEKEPSVTWVISDMPHGTGVGDPTGILVVNKAEAEERLPVLYAELKQIERTIAAVKNDLYRQLLECRFISGLSHRETARVLYLSESVVRNNQRNAIEAIDLEKSTE